MWRHYLVFSFRNLVRFRSTTVLQLLGFVIGLGAFIPVVLVLHYHLAFDQFHKLSERIVRVSTQINLPASASVYAATSRSLAPLIKEQLSLAEEVVRCRFVSANIKVDGKMMGEENPLFADAGFFRIFSAETILGNIDQVLTDPNSVVITASAGERFFGKENPLGKLVSVETPAGDFLLEVKAVVNDYPENVSLRFQMLANFSLIAESMSSEAGALVPGLFTLCTFRRRRY